MSDANSLSSFAKILALEMDKGYTNQAVIGGMDAYLARLVDAEWNALSADLLAHINHVLATAGGYSQWDTANRASWVTTALSVVTVGSSEQDTPPVKARSSPRTMRSSMRSRT